MIRSKKAHVLDKVLKHFTEFKLPLDIEYKAYVAIVGRDSISPATLKRNFKHWKYILRHLSLHYPELSQKPVVKPVVKPAVKPVQASTPKASYAKPAVKPAVKKEK